MARGKGFAGIVGRKKATTWGTPVAPAALGGFEVTSIETPGPIVEEIAFRGMVFNSVRKRGLGALWTILISAVLFAAFHLEPIRFFILLPIGVLYGWLRWRTGALGAPIIAHMVNNGPAAVVLLLGLPEVTP